jgi:hypothetical protein
MGDEKIPTPATFWAATLKSYETLEDGNVTIAFVAAEFVLYVYHIPTGDVVL